MRKATAAALVFLAGFIIMVLEIIGARFLAKDFGSSFHVWVSQIGVVLIALALGYYLGGALADRWQRLWILIVLLLPAGLALWLIPNCAAWLMFSPKTSLPATLSFRLKCSSASMAARPYGACCGLAMATRRTEGSRRISIF